MGGMITHRSLTQLLVFSMMLAGCASARQVHLDASQAAPLQAPILASETPRPTLTDTPTATATATVTLTATTTLSPTLSATPTLVAATMVIGYRYAQETRGAVTLRRTDGTIDYLVHGSTADEITRQMKALGPRDPIGHFLWYGLTTPLYDVDTACGCSDAGCASPTVTVNLLINYMLPHWSEPGMEHDRLAAYWSYFEGAITTHEQGHGDIAATCAWQMGDAITALPPAATCEAYSAAVNAARIAVSAQCRQMQQAYDNSTGHGATQGVVWPPDIP
jgi:predicted secreted Zn-dependent protease